jgi:DNA-binding XRE family transcriptional regulator
MYSYELLKKYREKSGLTQDTFAAFCNHIIYQEKNGQDKKIEDAKKIKKEIEHWSNLKEK